MKRLNWLELNEQERAAALARPQQRTDAALQRRVRSIVDNVRTGGWTALCDIAREIDASEPQRIDVAPLAAEARRTLARDEVAAVELAASNIRAFHKASMPADVSVETMPGLTVRKLWRAIDRVGLYVPGGKTPLFSTLLMLGIPAQVAGVREVVAVTPPRPDGGLDPVIALAAELCGIGTMWTVGGAQAVAALAFGAGEMPKTDKVCGPGNAWVAEAKRVVASEPGGPAIDMPAGPSELMVIADSIADPALIAADLLSQAEHDAAAQVLLLTTSQLVVTEVSRELERQLTALPRASIVQSSLASARLIVVPDLATAAGIANSYAPEHLSLAIVEPDLLLSSIRNAGAVFAGALAAETFGDYLAGSSHVLPTDGAARAWGGVSVHTFLKAMSVQSVTREAVRQVAPPAGLLARIEKLEAHARAADARLEYAQ